MAANLKWWKELERPVTVFVSYSAISLLRLPAWRECKHRATRNENYLVMMTQTASRLEMYVIKTFGKFTNEKRLDIIVKRNFQSPKNVSSVTKEEDSSVSKMFIAFGYLQSEASLLSKKH